MDSYYLDYLLRLGVRYILGTTPSEVRYIRQKAGEYKAAYALFSQYERRAATQDDSANMVVMATYLLFMYGWFSLDRGPGIRLEDRKGFFDLMLEVDRLGRKHAENLRGDPDWSFQSHQFHIEEARLFIEHRSYDEALAALEQVAASVRKDVPDTEIRSEIVSKLGSHYCRLAWRLRSPLLLARGLWYLATRSAGQRANKADPALVAGPATETADV